MMDARTHRDAFADALCRAFEMKHDDAAEIADAVLGCFASVDEVDDDTLDTDLRSVFYTLEGKRMLSFRRVEYTREDGDKRRAFYWKLRLETLLAASARSVEVEDMDVYATLPPSAWRHAAT